MSENGGVKLIEFAKNGNLDAVRQQLLDGSDVNYRCPPDGATALYWAACNGHISVCDWLVWHGANVNQSVEKSGSLPLHGAADRGHDDCVQLLIRKGSHIDAITKSNSDTALHLAAYRGHSNVCRVLLQHGACAEALNAQGVTALDEAQTQSHYDIYQLLWKHRQRQQCCLIERPTVGSRLSKILRHSPTPEPPKPNKTSKKMLSSTTTTNSIPDKHGERILETTELLCHRTEIVESYSSTISTGDNVSGSTNRQRDDSKSISDAVMKLAQSHSEGNANTYSPRNGVTSQCGGVVVENDVNAADGDDDVTQELIRKLDKLVDYSDALQIQLTIRQDENDQLKRENLDLSRRLDFFQKVAETIEDMSRARAECEQKALRAEKELMIAKQRYASLENSSRSILESRLRRPAHVICSKISSGNRLSLKFGSIDTDELQPRG